MAWYIDPDGVTWQKRAAITILNEGGGAAAGADVDVPLLATWEAFWSVIDSAGNHIRVTNADGLNLVSYDIDDGSGGTFDATAVAARTGRIRVDGVDVNADCNQLLWVYFDPSTTAADGSSAIVIAAALPGVIEHDGPGPRQFIYGPQPPRSQSPRDVTHKDPSEALDLWIRLDGAFSRLQRASSNSRYFEEAYTHTMSVVDTANADQATMYDLNANRFVWVDRGPGELWLMVKVQAGTDDTLYTAVPSVLTCIPAGTTLVTRQTIEPHVGISVRNTRFE